MFTIVPCDVVEQSRSSACVSASGATTFTS